MYLTLWNIVCFCGLAMTGRQQLRHASRRITSTRCGVELKYLNLHNVSPYEFAGLHNVHGHPRHRRQTNTTVHLSHSTKNAADRIQVISKPTVAKFGCFPNILDRPVPSNKLKVCRNIIVILLCFLVFF